MEGFSEIHWHDSQIESVVDISTDDILALNVQYPVDWDNDDYQPRAIVFEDYFAYEVHEMPFESCPTILDADVLAEVGSPFSATGCFKIHIATNAGSRFITAARIHLRDSYVGI